MANKDRYTVAQVINAAEGTRGIMTLIAGKLGCHRSTIANYAQRYGSVAEAIHQERETLVDIAEGQLAAAVRAAEPWAVLFTLRTLGKARGFAYTDVAVAVETRNENTVIVLTD